MLRGGFAFGIAGIKPIGQTPCTMTMQQATSQSFAGRGGGGAISAFQNAINEAARQRATEETNAYSVADTTADREASDYMASANQRQSERTNSLAQRLAEARRTPGGGLRLGIRAKGFNANSAGAGLNAANAKDRLGKRKAELRAQAKSSIDASRAGQSGMTVSMGAPIQLW